jgi:chaperone modulatory protein CbpM
VTAGPAAEPDSRPTRVTDTYLLARRPELSLDTFARRGGLHPDLLRRFVALGLVPCRYDARGDLWFDPAALVVIGRIQRLRLGLGLNYAAIGVVLDLLERIDELESASRRRGIT